MTTAINTPATAKGAPSKKATGTRISENLLSWPAQKEQAFKAVGPTSKRKTHIHTKLDLIKLRILSYNYELNLNPSKREIIH